MQFGGQYGGLAKFGGSPNLADQYYRVLKSIALPGFWNQDDASKINYVLRTLCRGLASGAISIANLEREIFPHTTAEMLTEWETLLGVATPSGASITARLENIVSAWRGQAIGTPDDVREILAGLGDWIYNDDSFLSNGSIGLYERVEYDGAVDIALSNKMSMVALSGATWGVGDDRATQANLPVAKGSGAFEFEISIETVTDPSIQYGINVGGERWRFAMELVRDRVSPGDYEIFCTTLVDNYHNTFPIGPPGSLIVALKTPYVFKAVYDGEDTVSFFVDGSHFVDISIPGAGWTSGVGDTLTADEIEIDRCGMHCRDSGTATGSDFSCNFLSCRMEYTDNPTHNVRIFEPDIDGIAQEIDLGHDDAARNRFQGYAYVGSVAHDESLRLSIGKQIDKVIDAQSRFRLCGSPALICDDPDSLTDRDPVT